MRFTRNLFLGALAIVSAPGYAAAGELPGVDEYLRLVDVVIAARNEAGAPLPESDPRVQALVAMASDRKVFGRSSIADSKSLSGEDVIRVADVATKTAEVLGGYLPPPAATPPPANIMARAVANGHKYHGVSGPLFAFSLTTMARSVAGFTTLLETVPQDQRAAKMPVVRTIRSGAIRLLSEVFGMTWPVEGADEKVRQTILHAAVDAAPVIAGSLTTTERKEVWRQAFQARVLAAPEDQGTLQKIDRAFMGTDCVDLCAFGE